MVFGVMMFGVMTFGLMISRVMLLGVMGVIFGAIFLMFCFGDCLDKFWGDFWDNFWGALDTFNLERFRIEAALILFFWGVGSKHKNLGKIKFELKFDEQKIDKK